MYNFNQTAEFTPYSTEKESWSKTCPLNDATCYIAVESVFPYTLQCITLQPPTWNSRHYNQALPTDLHLSHPFSFHLPSAFGSLFTSFWLMPRVPTGNRCSELTAELMGVNLYQESRSLYCFLYPLFKKLNSNLLGTLQSDEQQNRNLQQQNG